MTCQECQNIFITTVPENVSRATRAAMLAHLDQCAACRCMLNEPPPDDELDQFYDDLYDTDSADPEFRDTVFGGEG